jgi:hypothetical protein
MLGKKLPAACSRRVTRVARLHASRVAVVTNQLSAERSSTATSSWAHRLVHAVWQASSRIVPDALTLPCDDPLQRPVVVGVESSELVVS